MEKKYVIVCNRHKGIVQDGLLFWSEDGGYTNNICKAKFHKIEELEEMEGRNVEVCDEESTIKNFILAQDIAITLEDLEGFGYKQMIVYVK